MKKALYIFCFTLFGLLVATLVHAGVELVALEVIFGNPDQFANSVWWLEWERIHAIFSGILWIAGLVLGLFGGFKYWNILYVEGNRTS